MQLISQTEKYGGESCDANMRLANLCLDFKNWCKINGYPGTLIEELTLSKLHIESFRFDYPTIAGQPGKGAPLKVLMVLSLFRYSRTCFQNMNNINTCKLFLSWLFKVYLFEKMKTESIFSVEATLCWSVVEFTRILDASSLWLEALMIRPNNNKTFNDFLLTLVCKPWEETDAIQAYR